jgi:hypothetical protein
VHIVKFRFLHLKHQEDDEKKDIYHQPYTHHTSVIRRKYYIDKRCTKMGGSKNVKKPNKKRFFIDQRTKIQKWVVQKMKRLKKRS